MLSPDNNRAEKDDCIVYPCTDLLDESRLPGSREQQTDAAGSSLGKHRCEDSDIHQTNPQVRVCLRNTNLDTSQKSWPQLPASSHAPASQMTTQKESMDDSLDVEQLFLAHSQALQRNHDQRIAKKEQGDKHSTKSCANCKNTLPDAFADSAGVNERAWVFHGRTRQSLICKDRIGCLPTYAGTLVKTANKDLQSKPGIADRLLLHARETRSLRSWNQIVYSALCPEAVDYVQRDSKKGRYYRSQSDTNSFSNPHPRLGKLIEVIGPAISETHKKGVLKQPNADMSSSQCYYQKCNLDMQEKTDTTWTVLESNIGGIKYQSVNCKNHNYQVTQVLFDPSLAKLSTGEKGYYRNLIQDVNISRWNLIRLILQPLLRSEVSS